MAGNQEPGKNTVKIQYSFVPSKQKHFFKKGHYLAVCTSGVLKMKNRGYEDTSYQSEQWQTHSNLNTGGERHPDDQGPLMAKDI